MAKVKIFKVRLAFPALWRPQAFVQADGTMGKPSFQATFLFPPTHAAVKAIAYEIKAVAGAKWGEKAAAQLVALKAEGKICLRNGDVKPDYDGFPGNMFLRASAPVKPLILDTDGETPLAEQGGRPYGGCYVNASVEIWAQQNGWGKRINATLKGLQFVADGDAFGAGPPATSDDFADLGMGSAAPAEAEAEDMFA